jgi:hypothetical protein
MTSTPTACGLVFAVLLTGACSGRLPPQGVVTQDSVPAVSGKLGDAGLAACDHYYAAQYTRCAGPTLPASENARVLGRFEQVCENEAALTGSGVTAATLEACASALDESPCELPEGPPVACNFQGTLAGGSACTDRIQCQSGECSGTVSYSPEGPTAPFTCGTCEPAAAVGQDCNSSGCPVTAACITADTSAAQPDYACVAVAQGGLGAACDGLSTICRPGFYCAEQTRTCQRLEVPHPHAASADVAHATKLHVRLLAIMTVFLSKGFCVIRDSRVADASRIRTGKSAHVRATGLENR